MAKTKIQWATRVWNPLTGCKKVSPGCANCYAEVMATRLKAMGRPEYQDAVDDKGRWTGKITLIPERMNDPLKWKKPQRVFLNSMSDLFHNDVPFDYIFKLFMVMEKCHWHTFMILTKRAERLWLFWDYYKLFSPSHTSFPKNVWLGVSVENQQTADDRVPLLLRVPAAVRFISYEPALGPVIFGEDTPEGLHSWLSGDIETGMGTIPKPEGAPRIHWLIAGGESGHNARPAHPDWFRTARDQCQAAGVAYFFKQWGEWKEVRTTSQNIVDRYVTDVQSHPGGDLFFRIGKKAAGRLLDGREWNQIPAGVV